MTRFLLLVLFSMLSVSVFAQLEVTNAAPITPENLISNVFLGDGVEVVSITYAGDQGAVGLFTQGSTTIGMERGIVMTTGTAVSNPGQTGVNAPASAQASFNNGSSATDADLLGIVGANIGISNVTSYTIEFIPVNDTLRFTYAFASEEYPEFACTNYNDVFGFFISGPGINGPYTNNAENIALIPGTDRPVTINNVNPGMPGAAGGTIANCSGDDGSLAFAGFYNANNGNTLPVYDGFTDVFVAQAVVEPCSTYTIKLVIADAFDAIFDSGVFLEAKSFGTGSLDVEIEGLAIDGGLAEGCGAGEIVFNLPSPVEADYDVEFAVGGTATPGVDYPTLPSTIIIPEGDSTFRLPISAYEDFLVEGDETIELSVQRDPCNRDTFTIIIKDNRLVDPDLGPDLIVCPTDETQLDGTVPIALPDPPRFVNDTPLAINQTNVPFISEIDVFGVLPVELGPEAIKMICIDSLEHQWIDDLDIYLVGPDGQFLELTTDNGAEGGNGIAYDYYEGTCFTIDATTVINSPGPFAPASAVPFTGEWLPEGVFSDLWDGNYRTNGTWQLVITDDTQGLGGTLFSWSICFNPVYQVEYSWSPAAGLSCTDCPDPIASADTSTTYILTVSDSYGCIKQDTINFDVLPALTMSPLQCGELTTSSVQVVWPAVAGAIGYEVSINGGPWIPASGSLEHLVTGLGLEEDVEVTVRAIATCPSFPSTITCTSLNCTPASLAAVPVDVNCFGGSDGSVQINVVSGTGPFSYELDGVTNNNGAFSGLTANNYVGVVTDGDGCPGNISFVIAEPPSPNITEVIENPLDCNGDTDGALTVAITDGNGPYSFDWGSGITDSIVTGLNAGMYAVDLVDAGNCPFTLNIELTEPALLSTSVAADSVNCFGENTGQARVIPDGGVGPYTYLWDNGQLTDTAFLVTAGTYNVEVTDAMGCISNNTITVEEPPVLSAVVSSTPALCNTSNTGSLMVVPSGGTPGYTYSWRDIGDNSIVGTTAAVIDQFAGTYELVVTDGNGCTYTEEIQIGEPDVLELTNLQTNQPTCTGALDGNATVEVQGGTGPYTITWDTGITGDNENALASGDHYVLVTDANMCTDSLAFMLDAPIAVSVDISAVATSCFQGTDGTATATPTGGTGPYTYLWSNGDTDPTATDLPAGMASVEVRDANNCLVVADIMVNEPTELTVMLSGTDPTCFQETNGSIVATPTGGVGPYTYAWSDTQTSDTATGLTASNYSVVVTDANSCTVTANLTLDEPTVLSLSTTSQEQACTGPANGEASVMPTGGTGPYTYLWEDGQQTATATGLTAGTYSVTVTDAQNCLLDISATVALAETVEILDFSVTDASCNDGSDGSIAVNLQGGTGPFTWSAPLTGLNAGNYTLTVTDANNCTDILQAVVAEPTALAISENVTNVICAGETTGEIDLSVSGGTAPYSYNWNTGANAEDITSLGAGSYTVTVTDAQGCSKIYSTSIAQASTLSLVGEVEDVVCNGASTGRVSTTVQGGQPPYAYSWSNGSSTSALPNVLAGDYTLTVTDDFGCTLVETFNIAEPTALSGSFLTDMVSCNGGRDGFIKGEMSGGTLPYRFRLDNGDWQPSPTFLALGAGNYTLWAEDAEGCPLLLGNPEITEPAEIMIDLGGNREVRFGDTIRVTPDISSDLPIITLEWSPYDSTWLSCPDCGSQEVFTNVQRDLFLTVVDENGCTSKAWIQIRVSKDFPVAVPTGFTPNGDGVNDRLLVHGLPGIEVVSYRIWDRWGEMLFEDAGFPVNDPTRGWDGNFRDDAVNGGVYLWQVEVRFPDDRTELFSGQTTLIR
ncbi:choice-of-anchor L domain-containing protein [Lewinella cohaerens]|uniref:choice-of-anchor L domain-containing protein n=1 Tax=Lewinella cohaerens TaxID=70995 RepID=UPI000364A489|nr:choice-of-anchor L domain-containing protein [Lewinella cohaerens]